MKYSDKELADIYREAQEKAAQARRLLFERGFKLITTTYGGQVFTYTGEEEPRFLNPSRAAFVKETKIEV